MSELQTPASRWKKPRLTAHHIELIVVVLNLVFLVVIFSFVTKQSDEPAQAIVPSSEGSSIPVQPDAVAPLSPSATSSTFLSNTDIDAVIVRMQAMQNSLQTMLLQLEQKGQFGETLTPGSVYAVPTTDEQLRSLWTEIEELYQVMQPLMVQVELANASQSSRSASELIALRTQVNTIHQRFAYLLSRVEAIQAIATTGSATGTMQWIDPMGVPSKTTMLDTAGLQQLYQNLATLQSMMQQLERQGTLP